MKGQPVVTKRDDFVVRKLQTAVLFMGAGLALAGIVAACAPAPERAEAKPTELTTNRFAADYEPLVQCEEDEACWAGSGDDDRPWDEVRAWAWRNSWYDHPGDCIVYLIPQAGDTLSQALIRCRDGRETLMLNGTENLEESK